METKNNNIPIYIQNILKENEVLHWVGDSGYKQSNKKLITKKFFISLLIFFVLMFILLYFKLSILSFIIPFLYIVYLGYTFMPLQEDYYFTNYRILIFKKEKFKKEYHYNKVYKILSKVGMNGVGLLLQINPTSPDERGMGYIIYPKGDLEEILGHLIRLWRPQSPHAHHFNRPFELMAKKHGLRIQKIDEKRNKITISGKYNDRVIIAQLGTTEQLQYFNIKLNCINNNNNYFKISPQKTWIAELPPFEMPDLILGDNIFDSKFILQSDNKLLLVHLFKDKKFRNKTIRVFNYMDGIAEMGSRIKVHKPKKKKVAPLKININESDILDEHLLSSLPEVPKNKEEKKKEEDKISVLRYNFNLFNRGIQWRIMANEISLIFEWVLELGDKIEEYNKL